MGFIIPLAVGAGLLGLWKTKSASDSAKAEWKAKEAYYQEAKKAKLWQEVESLLHGGLGVTMPIQPPGPEPKAGLFDYLTSGGLGALQMYLLAGGKFPSLAGGSKSPGDLLDSPVPGSGLPYESNVHFA
jgi:hypothetical protein